MPWHIWVILIIIENLAIIQTNQTSCDLFRKWSITHLSHNIYTDTFWPHSCITSANSIFCLDPACCCCCCCCLAQLQLQLSFHVIVAPLLLQTSLSTPCCMLEWKVRGVGKLLHLKFQLHNLFFSVFQYNLTSISARQQTVLQAGTNSNFEVMSHKYVKKLIPPHT